MIIKSLAINFFQKSELISEYNLTYLSELTFETEIIDREIDRGININMHEYC